MKFLHADRWNTLTIASWLSCWVLTMKYRRSREYSRKGEWK